MKGKTHKIIFFYPPWLQTSVSLILAPTLLFSFSMFGNVPAAKNSSTLSCNSANSLFFVSSICAFSCHQQLTPNSIRFCKLARQKGQKVFLKYNDSGRSRSFPLVPWKHLFCKGKANMDNKSTLEDACTRRECSAICPLKQFFSKGRNRCTNKSTLKDACIRSGFLFVHWSTSSPRERRKQLHNKSTLGMHAQGGMSSYCTLKHFFSKGKKKKMHTKALWRQQEEFSYCPLQHFYEGRKKER